MNKLRFISSIILFLTSYLHLHVTPNSKVEESFNLQATHDLYYHGITPLLSQLFTKTTASFTTTTSSKNVEGSDVVKEYYDHLQYPGVVPRTFIGAFVLSSICKLIRLFLCIPFIGMDINEQPKVVDYLCRFILLLLNLHAYIRLASAAERHLQPQVGEKENSTTTSTKLEDIKATRGLSVVRLRGLKKEDFDTISSSPDNENVRQRRNAAVNQSICLRASSIPQNSTIQTSKSSSSGVTPTVASYFLLLTASQFHLPYYSSRMLPNIFALVLVTHAYAYWFQQKYYSTLSLLTIATVIFRCDVVLLLGSIALSMLFLRQVSILKVIQTCLTSAIVALCMTVPIDSLLWNRWTWPEGEVFFFNAIANKSSLWGTHPFHWYFTHAIPKAMLFTVILIIPSFMRIADMLYAIVIQIQSSNRQATASNRISIQTLPPLVDVTILPYLIPILLFVDIYSFLPHKEIRFIFMALPMLNVVAAFGLARLHTLAFKQRIKYSSTTTTTTTSTSLYRTRGVLAKGMYWIGIALLVVSFFASTFFLWISHFNYPGGEALAILQTQMEQRCNLQSNPQYKFFHENKKNPTIPTNQNNPILLSVYIDVASAMTGVSRFNQHAASLITCNNKQLSSTTSSTPITLAWEFTKEGYESENIISKEANMSLQFTHLLSEERIWDGFHVIGIARGNPKIHVHWKDIWNFEFLSLDDVIYILERDDLKTLFY